MALKNIALGDSVAMAKKGGSESESNSKGSVNSKIINVYNDTEASFREEIMFKLSLNLISPEEATLAWDESFMRDLKKVKKELQFVSKGLRGKGGKRGRKGYRKRVGVRF